MVEKSRVEDFLDWSLGLRSLKLWCPFTKKLCKNAIIFQQALDEVKAATKRSRIRIEGYERELQQIIVLEDVIKKAKQVNALGGTGYIANITGSLLLKNWWKICFFGVIWRIHFLFLLKKIICCLEFLSFLKHFT